MSVDQFKVQHLRERIASLTLKFEDDLAVSAVSLQVLSQRLETAQQELQEACQLLVEKDAEINRLKDEYEPALDITPEPVNED